MPAEAAEMSSTTSERRMRQSRAMNVQLTTGYVYKMQQSTPHRPTPVHQTYLRTVRQTYNCGGRPIAAVEDATSGVAEVLESASHKGYGRYARRLTQARCSGYVCGLQP